MAIATMNLSMVTKMTAVVARPLSLASIAAKMILFGKEQKTDSGLPAFMA